MTDDYEAARKTFEAHGEKMQERRRSRQQLKTVVILLTICAVEMALMLWMFGPPR